MNTPASEGRAFWTMLALGGLLFPAALAPALFLGVDFAALFNPSPAALFAGAVGVLPPLALLAIFMRSDFGPVARFRRSQLEFFRKLGFALTPFRNALLSLLAGAGEELLFRGVLQTVAERHLPVAFAILLPNLLFGALHARTKLYALAAFGVGAWLGALYSLTESLAAPMLTHALYDFIALEWTRRALRS